VHGQGGFANAGGAGQRGHEHRGRLPIRAAGHSVELGQFAGAAGEAGHVEGKLRRDGRLYQVRRRRLVEIAPQDRQVDALEIWAGLDAQVLDEASPSADVTVERLGPAAGGMQRPHQRDRKRFR
jgi:hypothetical protein